MTYWEEQEIGSLTRFYRECGRNFMTPTVLRVRFAVGARAVVELSEGTGFDHQPIYGVSVLNCGYNHKRVFLKDDPSKVFRNRQEAELYYLSVRPQLTNE